MFDVSFSELMIIAAIALIFIGPEKLPKVARTVGTLMGRMQRYVAQVKEEVNREVRFEELQKLQQEIKQSVQQEVKEVTASVQEGLPVELGGQTMPNAAPKNEPEVASQQEPASLEPASAPVQKTQTRKAARKKSSDSLKESN